MWDGDALCRDGLSLHYNFSTVDKGSRGSSDENKLTGRRDEVQGLYEEGERGEIWQRDEVSTWTEPMSLTIATQIMTFATDYGYRTERDLRYATIELTKITSLENFIHLLSRLSPWRVTKRHIQGSWF